MLLKCTVIETLGYQINLFSRGFRREVCTTQGDVGCFHRARTLTLTTTVSWAYLAAGVHTRMTKLEPRHVSQEGAWKIISIIFTNSTLVGTDFRTLPS